MKKTLANHFFLLLFFCHTQVSAQKMVDISVPFGGEYIYSKNTATNPCISEAEYNEIENEIAHNNRMLGISNNTQHRIMTTLFNWPLKAATGFKDCGFYFIGAFVDQNVATTSISDFSCGTNTYDGHRGTDIAIFPYGFYKMDNNQVEVVAAAAGTIIAKSDGNFDKNCSMNSLTANSIIIQHADGSEALYWHMKKNSVTNKTIGQTVAAGEYLGIVGSSGSSTGPHLHFEVWAGNTNTTRQDPYSGACNTLNANTWWNAQKPAIDPAVLKVSTNTTDLIMPGCPTTETPNESTTFTIPFQGAGLPAGYAKFYIFLRDATVGSTVDLKILNPNGSTFSSWTYSPSTLYKASYWGWSKLLPTIAGTYKFQATYNGTTCFQNFNILTSSTATANFTSSDTVVCLGSSLTFTNTSTASSGTPDSVRWTIGGGMPSTSNSMTTITPTFNVAGNFIISLIAYKGGTPSTAISKSIRVKTLPVVTVNSPTICSGNSTILSASGATNYTWSGGLAAVSNPTTPILSTTKSYTVTGTVGNCSNSAIATVTVNPLPATPTITQNTASDTLYCSYNIVGASYEWYKGGLLISTTTIPYYKINSNGIYSVKVINNGCRSIVSANYTAIYTSTTINSSVKNIFELYPNPTNGILTIKGSGIENGNYKLALLDVIGQILLTDEIKVTNRNLEKTISISHLANNIYFLIIEDGNGVINKMILKQD